MAGLSYDQGPPFGLPLRFLLSAPLFLMLAAAVGLAAGLDGRWSPAVLAVTHLVTLGYLGMVMLGALLQIMPVVLGAPLPAVRAVALWSWAGLALGTPLLSAGLGLGRPGLLATAAVALLAGFLPFLVALAVGLARSAVASEVAWPLRQAWLALLVTVALGGGLAAVLAGRIDVADFVGLVQLHLAWGLGGWVLILVVGVAYQVVPMLQLTPAYPTLASRWLGWSILCGLAGYSASRLGPDSAWTAGSLALLGLGAASFAVVTLRLQGRRRRKLGDVTLSFWRLGMAGLLACAALSPWLAGERVQLSFGIVFLLGFAASVVNGMLYKIVPFLAWFHLQAQKGIRSGPIPNMKEFVPDGDAARHLYLHGAALACLAPAPFLPRPVETIGCLLLLLSGHRLWLNLLRARRRFLDCGGRL